MDSISHEKEEPNTEPFFSIIVPTYNRVHMISETIDRILKQTFSCYEVIVIDDGGTDETLEVLKKIKNKRLFVYHTDNRGRSAARNYGASKARGKYLNFFDSDDIMYPNHLANAFSHVKDAYPPIFHSGYDIVNKDLAWEREETNFCYDVRKRLIKTNFLCCNSVFVRRDVFQNNHPFREDMSKAEDLEIFLEYSTPDSHSSLQIPRLFP